MMWFGTALQSENDDAPEGRPPVIIDKRALVPVYVIGGVLAVLFLALNYLDNRFAPVARIETNVRDIGYRLDEIEGILADRWSATHQKMWELQLKQMNPSLQLPNTWDIVGRKP